MWRNVQVKRSEKGKPNSKLNSSKKKFKYVILFITWLSACISHPILKETSLIHCRSKVWNFTIKWILYHFTVFRDPIEPYWNIWSNFIFLVFFFLPSGRGEGTPIQKGSPSPPPPTPSLGSCSWLEWKVTKLAFKCFLALIFVLSLCLNEYYND